MMWPGPGSSNSVALRVPVDDVPAAGAEPEVDGGGVEHHPVADRDRAGELGQRVGAPAVGVDPLEAGPLLEERRDDGGPEGGHCSYKEAMSFSTRSSRDRNGSLQSTVRCAWSLSFRCTQSTV